MLVRLVADLTVGSSKNYDINSGPFKIGKRVSAEDTYGVFIFPFGIPSMKTAMDKAIEQDKCAVGLSDLVVTRLNHSFLVGKTGVRVEGDLILDPSLPGCSQAK